MLLLLTPFMYRQFEKNIVGSHNLFEMLHVWPAMLQALRFGIALDNLRVSLAHTKKRTSSWTEAGRPRNKLFPCVFSTSVDR